MKTVTKFVVVLLFFSLGTGVSFGESKLNTSRVKREPGWSGPALLSGPAKDANKDIPILERPYRPGHVYGNMTRRHHYRDTVIPSHRDRVEMLDALLSKQPVQNKYVKDKYR